MKDPGYLDRTDHSQPITNDCTWSRNETRGISTGEDRQLSQMPLINKGMRGTDGKRSLESNYRDILGTIHLFIALPEYPEIRNSRRLIWKWYCDEIRGWSESFVRRLVQRWENIGGGENDPYPAVPDLGG